MMRSSMARSRSFKRCVFIWEVPPTLLGSDASSLKHPNRCSGVAFGHFGGAGRTVAWGRLATPAASRRDVLADALIPQHESIGPRDYEFSGTNSSKQMSAGNKHWRRR